MSWQRVGEGPAAGGPVVLLREHLCCQKALGIKEDGGIRLLFKASVYLSKGYVQDLVNCFSSVFVCASVELFLRALFSLS